MARKSTNNPRPKRRRGMEMRRGRPKPCAFCKQQVDFIDWKDVSVLRKYMSDRGKIRGRRVNGNCPGQPMRSDPGGSDPGSGPYTGSTASPESVVKSSSRTCPAATARAYDSRHRRAADPTSSVMRRPPPPSDRGSAG